MRTAKTLLRLGGCPGCSESLLGAHAILLVLSRGGSYCYKGENPEFQFYESILLEKTDCLWTESGQNIERFIILI